MKKVLLGLVLVSFVGFASPEPLDFFGLTAGIEISEAEVFLANMGAIKDVNTPGVYDLMSSTDITKTVMVVIFPIDYSISKQIRIILTSRISTWKDVFEGMYGEAHVSGYDKSGYPWYRWYDNKTQISLYSISTNRNGSYATIDETSEELKILKQ